MSSNAEQKDASCEARINDELVSREEYVESLLNAIGNDEPFDGYDDPLDALHEFPLGVSKYEIIRIDLSTGGPGDWIEAKIDSRDNEILSVTYHFNDWFDHASRKLNEHSPLWAYAEQIVDTYYS